MSDKTIDAVIVPETSLARSAVAGEVLSMQGNKSSEELLEIATKRVEFFDKVTKLSLKRTSVHDWVDQNGKPYLQATGAEKLMALWGIYTQDVTIHIDMDATTGFPIYEVTGRVGSRTLGTEMDVIGGRNANDKFYQDQLAKTGRLDLLDVRKAAYSNWLVNAITRIIGMRGLTWADVKAATSGSVTEKTATGQVSYKKSEPTANATPPPATTEAEPPTQEPSSASPRQSDGPAISEAQGKRFFAIAKGAGWQDSEIKEYLLREYGIEHSRDIKRADYEAICKAMQEGASH